MMLNNEDNCIWSGECEECPFREECEECII